MAENNSPNIRFITSGIYMKYVKRKKNPSLKCSLAIQSMTFLNT